MIKTNNNNNNNKLIINDDYTYISQCKSLGLPKCKRMTEAMIQNAKKCLKNLTKCEDIHASEDPMADFGKAIMNYYQHYTDDHSSTWCRFHKKVTK